MPTLDLGDLQGNILRGYGRRYPDAHHAFIRFGGAESGRRLLAALGKQMTRAEWESAPRVAVNLALSYSGFAALGLPDALLESFPVPFREGFAERAPRWGDYRSTWEAVWTETELHLLVAAPELLGAEGGRHR